MKNNCECKNSKNGCDCYCCLRIACIRIIREKKELWVCWNCIKIGDEVADDYGD